MALSRLGNTRRSENFTWPGFVDALASLLMVIIFVLMVFVLIQANLVYRVSGQDATLGEMRQQLASLSELLNIERRASADLAADLAKSKSSLAAGIDTALGAVDIVEDMHASASYRRRVVAELAGRAIGDALNEITADLA